MVVHPVHTDENCDLVQTISGSVEKIFGRNRS